MDTIVEKHRSHLPHIQLEGQIISLTWRLAFTLPKNILDLQEALKKDLEETDRNEASRLSNRYASYIKKLEELDTFLGKCEVDGLSLCADENARILISAINFHDNKMYDLHCYCIMPNHVHILVKPLLGKDGAYYKISTIVQRLKTYTANMFNQHRGSRGKIWHRDYFDRYIRNPVDYRNVVKYILENPVKAGLVSKAEDWKYSRY
ncbi:MAG: REP-associated tyrosine transposase [Candidatus Syntrophosphaera sp.]